MLIPGKAETDIVFFDRPVDGIKELHLELPGKTVGLDEPIRFKIAANRVINKPGSSKP